MLQNNDTTCVHVLKAIRASCPSFMGTFVYDVIAQEKYTKKELQTFGFKIEMKLIKLT